MHGNIVHVRADAVVDIKAKACRLRGLTEMLLLIGNVMLSTCNDTSTLDTLNRLGELDPGQDWVRAVWRCQRLENLVQRK